MGRMRYTGKCHHKGCKNYIDESMARLVAIYWYYCSRECAIKAGQMKKYLIMKGYENGK